MICGYDNIRQALVKQGESFNDRPQLYIFSDIMNPQRKGELLCYHLNTTFYLVCIWNYQEVYNTVYFRTTNGQATPAYNKRKQNTKQLNGKKRANKTRNVKPLLIPLTIKFPTLDEQCLKCYWKAWLRPLNITLIIQPDFHITLKLAHITDKNRFKVFTFKYKILYPVI